MRATRRTRWRPRADSRPLLSAWASTSAASGWSGASSSSRSTGMAALVRDAPLGGDAPAPPAPARAPAAVGSLRSVPIRSLTDGRVTSTRRSKRSRSGPGQAALVARPGAVGAAAAAGPAAVAARARVHGGHEQEPGREGDGAGGPGHPHHALLERLAQRVEHVLGELGQLVEEQHAVARGADLARAASWRCRRRPARPTTRRGAGARNGGWRTSPPGGSPRPAAEWMRVVSSASRSVSGGSRPGQPRGQHRLAGAGRAEQEEVVAPSRRHLQGEAPDRLPADVGQVGHARERRRRAAVGGPRATAARPAGTPRPRSSVVTAWIVRPPTSRASSALAAGSTTARSPRASVRQSVPATGRTEPSRPSSPRNASPSTAVGVDLLGGHEDRRRRWRGRGPSRSCGRWAAPGSR